MSQLLIGLTKPFSQSKFVLRSNLQTIGEQDKEWSRELLVHTDHTVL